MNLLVDIYDLVIKAFYFALGFPLTDCFFYAVLSYVLIRKFGGTKFLWIKLKSLRDFRKEAVSESEYKRKRNADLAWIALCFLAIKMMVFPIAMFKFFDESEHLGDRTYSLERDELFLAAGLHGMTMIPFVWVPAYMGINKFRQWVDPETMVTWKYHDERRKCFWSGYKDSSCDYAMSMARALHRDDESLKIGRKFVNARKDSGSYGYCYALSAFQGHAEQVEDIPLYKEIVMEKCELDCHYGCKDHKMAQEYSDALLKRSRFPSRHSIESFLR